METNEVKNIGERPDSTEISVNAKGMWSGKVKVYREDVEQSMAAAIEKALQLQELIRCKNG